MLRVEAGCSPAPAGEAGDADRQAQQQTWPVPTRRGAEAETPWVEPQETSSDPRAHVQSQAWPEGLFLCVYHTPLTFCLSNLYVYLKYTLICKTDTIFYHSENFAISANIIRQGCVVHQGEGGGRGYTALVSLVEASVELGSRKFIDRKGSQMVPACHSKF